MQARPSQGLTTIGVDGDKSQQLVEADRILDLGHVQHRSGISSFCGHGASQVTPQISVLIRLDLEPGAPYLVVFEKRGLSYPPAMAPMMSRGSLPEATASGSGASGDSCAKSSSQPKNRTKARLSRVTWPRIVPRSMR